jgi:cysteine sulfinate desulfinase/cysteine desulfurase-like protein
MMPYLTAEWGNPSSAYKFGSKLKSVIAMAREQVADLIGAHSMDVIFTSCATESNNAAIAAALRANPAKRHIVTSQVEHSSVLNYCMALEKSSTPLLGQEGAGGGPYRVTYLPVGRDGLVKLADLEAAITEQTAIVSLMWANNETGVLFPVEQIAETCRARGVLYDCDAVQAAGKVQRAARICAMTTDSQGQSFGFTSGSANQVSFFATSATGTILDARASLQIASACATNCIGNLSASATMDSHRVTLARGA